MDKLTKEQSDEFLHCIDQLFRKEYALTVKHAAAAGKWRVELDKNKIWKEKMEKMVLRRTEGWSEQQALNHSLKEAWEAQYRREYLHSVND